MGSLAATRAATYWSARWLAPEGSPLKRRASAALMSAPLFWKLGSFSAAADPGPLGAAVIHDGVLGCHPRSHVLVGHVVGAGRIAAQKAGQRGLDERTVILEVGIFFGGLKIEVPGVGEVSGDQVDIAHGIERVGVVGAQRRVAPKGAHGAIHIAGLPGGVSHGVE